MKYLKLAAAAAAASAALIAADAPYIGLWKMNPARSNMAGTTLVYQKLPSGEWETTADGHSYKFKTDGNDYPDGLGDTVEWKESGPNTWQAVWKLNGKTLATETLRAGADGILTIHTTGTRPNGEAIDETTTFQRVSGGPGLSGKWKSKAMQSSSPDVLELASTGGDTLAVKFPAEGFVCDGKLDGKDYPCTGPTAPPGWSISMQRTGANSFTVAVQNNGKPMYRFPYSVSADGKTLTATGGAIATDEKIKIVYNRQ
jgi:hypothetical protein